MCDILHTESHSSTHFTPLEELRARPARDTRVDAHDVVEIGAQRPDLRPCRGFSNEELMFADDARFRRATRFD